MKITIQRIEKVVITGRHEPIDAREFSSWDDAFAYLVGCGWPLSEDHKAAFSANSYTETNTKMEMVSRGNVAYSANVFYVVEVSA